MRLMCVKPLLVQSKKKKIRIWWNKLPTNEGNVMTRNGFEELWNAWLASHAGNLLFCSIQMLPLYCSCVSFSSWRNPKRLVLKYLHLDIVFDVLPVKECVKGCTCYWRFWLSCTLKPYVNFDVNCCVQNHSTKSQCP